MSLDAKMTVEESTWSPQSWRKCTLEQQAVAFKQADILESTISKLSSLPELVSVEEILSLANSLYCARQRSAFVLQSGDCAETFENCTGNYIKSLIELTLQMSEKIAHETGTKVVPIARIAGQYAKPRSNSLEKLEDGTAISSYRGDMVNNIDSRDREPNPNRLLLAYFHSSATLNFMRIHKLCPPMIYVSHEALVLNYDSQLTRPFLSQTFAKNEEARYYNVSTHFPWIGDRTRHLNGAHVEYSRGISNPIGVKIGPSVNGDDLIELLNVLQTDKRPVVLICRYGAELARKFLEQHLKAVSFSDHRDRVLWMCDPMHGNTVTTECGRKTRNVADIESEISTSFDVHSENSSWLAGVHLEATGLSVTECIGNGITSSSLDQRYETFCDPRLNAVQALSIASFISAKLKSLKGN